MKHISKFNQSLENTLPCENSVQGESRKGFTQVPNWLISFDGISAEAKLLYIYLLSHHCSFNPYCAKICADLGCSVRRILRMEKELIAAGLLSKRQGRKDGGFGPCIYECVSFFCVDTEPACTKRDDTKCACTKVHDIRIHKEKKKNKKEEKKERNYCADRAKKVSSIFNSFSEETKSRLCREHNISLENLETAIEHTREYMEAEARYLTRSTATSLLRRQIELEKFPPAGALEDRKEAFRQRIRTTDEIEKVNISAIDAFFRYYVQVDRHGRMRFECDPYFDISHKLWQWINRPSKNLNIY